MRAFVHIGVCICGILLLAGCNLQVAGGATSVPTPDIPRVEILSPANRQQVIEGTEFDIDIVARDETGGISRVQLRIDGEDINEAEPVAADSVPVFRVTMNWKARTPGLHNIEAIAYRPDGTPSDPTGIVIEVVPRE